MQIGLIFCFLIGLAFFYWLFVGLTQGKSIQKEIDSNQAKRKIQKFNNENESLGYKFSLFTTQFKYPYLKIPSFESFTTATLPFLNDTVLYDLADKHTIGKSEFVLEEKLKQKFGEKLIIGGGLYCLKSFKPDIAYIDKEKKIFIDIEIDEVYDLKTKTPIHYLDIIEENGKRKINDVNENRDRVFSSNGWTVIRFSEEQILANTDECVTLVEYIINFWLRNPTKYKLEDIKIKEAKRWTAKEAKSFANEKYRDKIFEAYLKEQPASEPPKVKISLADIFADVKLVTPIPYDYYDKKEDTQQ